MSYTILSPMNLCPKCQNANPDDSKFCIQCGAALVLDTKKNAFTLTQIGEKGVEVKSVSFESEYNFSKSKDFVDFNAKKNKVEIKSEGEKLFIKDNGSFGVYIKVPNARLVELEIGQEFVIDGIHFKVS